MSLDKAFEAKKYEDDIYARWEKSGFFAPEGHPPLVDGEVDTREPFSIMMPPPNVTGVLHLGHALENTLMDTMARYQRMQGKKVLLVPGTDHAALPTQAKVEKILMGQGIKHPRQELGREKLVEKIREFADGSRSTILSQIKKMGTSCDWSRLAYTFDEDRSRAVNEMFVRMYNDGLIYRGFRVVNWSVKGQSTSSDDEIEYVERPSKLYTFKYSKDFPITIATTRPETKLGDTAVAVHPNDPRYQVYIGKVFTIEVGADKPLEIKIITDEGIDMAFGTGALGVTPAHSAIDFAMYEKQKAAQNPIGLVAVIGIDGRMTEAAGKGYVGLTVEEAREKFVVWLRTEGLLEKEEGITQSVGTSDRFGDVIEAVPMTQWWLDVNKKIPGRDKTLRELMREALTTGLGGDVSQKVVVNPERWTKLALERIDHLRDWCLSRQIWWGHRIPVWYRGEEQSVGAEAPAGDGWEQDPDTLDTWFSSGLWTFSTLGWPLRQAQGKLDDLKNYHPTSWIQMGHEIVYLWLLRMILMSTYALGEIPFSQVYIHGILRDEHGKKFSKSSGNGIDPIDVIAEYGTDALRYSVISGITPGNDSRFYTEKIEGARNLVNKIWNISRFILLGIPEPKQDINQPDPKTLADTWILYRLQELIQSVTDSLNSFNFSRATELLYEFTWNDLADWYLEISKIEGDKSDILNYILNTLLKLWHPYLPFVTEILWQEMYGKESFIMVQEWPKAKMVASAESIQDFTLLQSIITSIRTARSENKIEPVKKITAKIVSGRSDSVVMKNEAIIKNLARLDILEIVTGGAQPPQSIGIVENGIHIYLDLGAVDTAAEKIRLQKEIDTVAPYVQIQEKKLSNEQFVANAPAAVVDLERKKLAEAKEKLSKLTEQIASLN